MAVWYNNLMAKLAIRMTAWQPYSRQHLEVAVIVVALALAFAFLFAKTNVNKTGVVTAFGVILLLFEILKQCLLTYVLGYYSWSDFPWQLCSIPLFVCLFYPSLKKHRETADVFLMSFGFLGGVAALIEPTSSFYSYLLLTIQSITWHGILLMLAFYMMMTTKSRSVHAFRGAAIWYVVAAAVAVLINFLTRNISKGEANLFFIGPSNPRVPILTTIYQTYGWVLSTVLMVLATLAAAFVVYFVSGARKHR